MSLNVRVEDGRSQTKTLVLEGRLDNESVGALDEALDAVLASAVKVVVFDLAGLEYITSAGLRSIFRAQKAMHARAGKSLLLNPHAPGAEGARHRQGPGARHAVQERPGARRLPRRDAEESGGRRVASDWARRDGLGGGTAMTIARRILLLVGLAPLVLARPRRAQPRPSWRGSSPAAGSWPRSRCPSLSALGNISRTFEEMRVALRDHLLAPDAAGRTKARGTFDARRGELDQLLRSYADTLVSDDRDRRSLDEFRAAGRRVDRPRRRKIMALSDAGRPRRRRAACWPAAAWPALGAHAGEALREWIAHNQDLAASAGADAPAATSRARGATPSSPWPSRCSCRAASAC